MGDIPTYEEEPTSELLQWAKSVGFDNWHRIPKWGQNAVYSLIAVAVLYHFDQDYEVSSFLRRKWSEKLPSLIQVHNSYQDSSKYSNSSFWAEISYALITDICRLFHGKPFIPTIQAGKMLQKGMDSVIASIMSAINIVLVWYEVGGMNVWNCESRDPGVFVCIVEEGDVYCLMYHKDILQQTVISGFPFFVKECRTARSQLPVSPFPAQAPFPPRVPSHPPASDPPVSDSSIATVLHQLISKLDQIEKKVDNIEAHCASLELKLINIERRSNSSLPPWSSS